MKQDEKKQSLYGRCIDFLRKPVFRILANFFSHGGTHFITLLIVLSLTAYYGFLKNSNNIVPHTMGIHLGWASSQDSVIQKIYPGFMPEDSIDDIKLHILLNSNKIKKQTKGVYNNGVIVEFYGKVKQRIFHNHLGQALIPPYNDSTIISVFNDPGLKSYDAFVKMDLLPNGDTNYRDSVGEDGRKIIVVTQKVIISAEDSSEVRKESLSDSIVKSNIKPKDGGIVSISLFPINYQGFLDQKTKYYVHFYSNEIGFNEGNPYYYYYLNFPPTKNAEIQSIDFQVSDSIIMEEYGMVYTKEKNLQFNYIYPEPDIIGNGRIVYYSKEKKDAIKRNQGVVIQAIDVNALNKQNRKAFLYSVLVGTGFAFLLDIIIQLIRELRRLHREEK